jgi:hypothetical protein
MSDSSISFASTRIARVRFIVAGKARDVSIDEARSLAHALRAIDLGPAPGDATESAIQLERALRDDRGPNVEMTVGEHRAILRLLEASRGVSGSLADRLERLYGALLRDLAGKG